MVETTDRERERIERDLTDRLGVHVETVRSRASDEARELMRLAEEDVDQIRAWTESELERVRQEAERRIQTRRGELDRHLSQHDAEIEREITAASDAVDNYRLELDSFVDQLAKVPDPTQIATLASHLPPPPRVEEIAAQARKTTVAEAPSETPSSQDTEASGPSSGATFPGTMADTDLIGVMDPGLTGRSAVSTGEMVGAHRPVPISVQPETSVGVTSVVSAEDEASEVALPEPARRPWTDVVLRVLPFIVLVAIVAAVAYLLLSGQANPSNT
jgi:hypothetical protein